MGSKPRLFVGNFDFEHRLAHGGGDLPRKLERRNAILAPSWLLIAKEQDAIWWPFREAPPSSERLTAAGLPCVAFIADPRPLATSYQLVFWAEDAWARRISTEWGFSWEGCDPAIIKVANSRRLQTELEQEFGVAPEGLRLVTNLQELTDAIGSLNDETGWILKAEFGGAGRESRRGQGTLSSEVVRWAAKRFMRQLAIVVEPRLDGIAEAGVQFQIDRAGDVEYLGITECIARPNGAFTASRLLTADEEAIWLDAVTIGGRLARRLAEAGYHGPLGIDAMRFRDKNGVEHLRPIQDINARYTMGRLALGLTSRPRLMGQRNGIFAPGDGWWRIEDRG